MAQGDKELVVDQDLEFQRRDWAFERIGWWGIVVIVLAAVAGVFGRGPLSATQTESTDHSLRVEYGRFERHGAKTELTVFIRRDSAGGQAVSLWVSDEFLRGVQVEEIDPAPVRQMSMGDRTLFDIAVTTDSARLTLAYVPRATGTRKLELGIMGRTPVSLSQFVYP
jgi:hypothetical protein